MTDKILCFREIDAIAWTVLHAAKTIEGKTIIQVPEDITFPPSKHFVPKEKYEELKKRFLAYQNIQQQLEPHLVPHSEIEEICSGDVREIEREAMGNSLIGKMLSEAGDASYLDCSTKVIEKEIRKSIQNALKIVRTRLLEKEGKK